MRTEKVYVVTYFSKEDNEDSIIGIAKSLHGVANEVVNYCGEREEISLPWDDEKAVDSYIQSLADSIKPIRTWTGRITYNGATVTCRDRTFNIHECWVSE